MAPKKTFNPDKDIGDLQLKTIVITGGKQCLVLYVQELIRRLTDAQQAMPA